MDLFFQEDLQNYKRIHKLDLLHFVEIESLTHEDQGKPLILSNHQIVSPLLLKYV